LKGIAVILILIPLFTFPLSLIFMVPAFDLDNMPIEFYSCQTPEGTQVTVVFKDEDHPNPIKNFTHDIDRYFKWGRIQDIESFYIKDDYIFFPDDYASVISFFETENLHTRAEIPLERFTEFAGSKVIYINTWNHMFSEKPLKGVSYILFFPSFKKGCRIDAERKYSFLVK